MTFPLIQEYHNKVQEIIQYGGSRNETAICDAFKTLIGKHCADKKIELISGIGLKTVHGTTVYPDGTLKDALRQDWGYWESKDTYDSLDIEIKKKLDKGYPTSNILFEDSQTAVLIQNGLEVYRTSFDDYTGLHNLISTFVNYEPLEVRTFREAIERFKEDLPDLIVKLRELIEDQASKNADFAISREDFLELCKESINPHIVMADVREMIIQHILTEDIFITIFNESQFHRENNIARALMEVIETFFTGGVRRGILSKIDPYIHIIKAAASGIADHHEKQRFLKVVYENFYRAYNPAAADRLGIIYTPNEIVKFMVESAEHLVHKNFGRLLSDKDVEILDPATGTGTFITEIIEHLPPNRLPFKYENEIHCNEVAILPYYIANLNIEYTYSQKMGQYAEFRNICFVDTLDNLGFSSLKKYRYTETENIDFGGVTLENLERIKRQNKRKISVIIGNPPYNANQLNENENNKNRPYPGVDDRIRKTYIAESTAQKTKLYDMYARFIRWASDRLDKDGVIAFVSNNSFVDSKTYDGFRKVVAKEFNEIYIIDMKGNARTSGERRKREGGNVFSDQIRVGVAVYFLVRKDRAKGCKIFYTCVDDYLTAGLKKAYLRDQRIQELPFDHIQPDKQYNWINLAENEWDDLLPVATKAIKSAKGKISYHSIFKWFSLGVSTNRDEWVFDADPISLTEKVQFFIEIYNRQMKTLDQKGEAEIDNWIDYSIKWSDVLKKNLIKKEKIIFTDVLTSELAYRPFLKRFYYAEKRLSDRLTSNHFELFGNDFLKDNLLITFSVVGSSRAFNILASKYLVDLHFIGDSQCLPLYRYSQDGNRRDNITDWALKQFQSHYQDRTITRPDIFHYVYAVLHCPAYREKYRLNLKREFPRIPFYEDFRKWVAWGVRLMELHVGYEQADSYPLKRIDKKTESGKPPLTIKPVLKIDSLIGAIHLDNVTTLTGVPPAAWEYKIGNRSSLEWVLEYHKERKPRDPTIRKKFNTYSFANHKEQVIDLLQRICTVSVETMDIIKLMKAEL